MRRAFHALRNGRPGPVVVELTADICAQEVPQAAQPYKLPKLVRQVPEHAAIEAAVDALIGAKRRVIWAGAGVLVSGGTAAFRQLAELTATPVFCTMPGKSAFDERHPLAFHTTNNSDDLNKDEATDIGLVGDTALTFEALIASIKAKTDGQGFGDRSKTEAAIAATKAEWLAEWTPILTADDEPITYYRVIQALNDTLDLENSIVTHYAGAPRDTIVPSTRRRHRTAISVGARPPTWDSASRS
jgi:acetolactate synthase I/II/III large subunit